MTQPCISVNALQVSVGQSQKKLLDNISFDVHPGEVLGIIGESGSGKSTLAATLLGLLSPPLVMSRGEVCLDGEPICLDNERAMKSVRGRKIAMIFQDPMTSWSPSFTIWTHIYDAVSAHGESRDRKAIFRQAVSLFEAVGIPDPEKAIRKYPHELSGGMRQRALIAIALMLRVRLIVADEPTSALDVTTQAQILRLLKDISRDYKTGIILISHDLRAIRRSADRVGVMHHGYLVETGGVDQIFDQPQHAYTARLLGSTPMVSRFSSTSLATHGSEAASPIILQTQNVNISYERPGMFTRMGFKSAARHAVRDISLTIRRGEIVGLIGESGAGKSTVGRAVMGLQPITSGTVELSGLPVHRLNGNDRKLLRRRVQMIFQDPHASLSPHMTIRALLNEAYDIHRISPQDRMDPVEMLATVEMAPEHLDKYPAQLSGGQARRIGIARALSLKPDLVIADEPSAGLDLSVASSVLSLMRRLRDETGQAYLIVSHDIDMLSLVADRICVMKDGEIVETGSTTQIIRTPAEPYTRMLIEASRDQDRF
ncbi:ABC transporter ATP-binding protein [Agrobacterium sp. ICMP 6402]|uniref:dipeptide ABC transporter ATP-binding protein n=1 Tax=Agrobacterium sp. ICMP 6402 TaxID=2292443 RepID=UPI0012956B4C|nr:ABC transporter ATP-binding protein [Agrobacterium sp. ICMP 6402]MQB12406.1 ABC transporter ATP-binding protein [Agrobacterium sp. ICMP 6402]